jgi:hypothetical protein
MMEKTLGSPCPKTPQFKNENSSLKINQFSSFLHWNPSLFISNKTPFSYN